MPIRLRSTRLCQVRGERAAMGCMPIFSASRCTMYSRPRYDSDAGKNACLTTSEYGMPTYSTIRKAAAPITGGMIWPLTELMVSMAPALTPP